MAERRMFAKTIVLSDAFLDLPLGSRCLYFTLGMMADDDGFVNSPKAVMRQCGASEDDLKILISKRFVLAFPSGVVVVKHWKINNYIQKDRYTGTKYQDEKQLIMTDENGAYTECIQNVSKMDTQYVYTQVRLGKDRLVEVSQVNKADGVGKPYEIPTEEQVTEYCNSKHYTFDIQRFIAWGERNEWCVNGKRINSWQAMCDAWQRRERNTETNTESSFDVDEFFEAALQATGGKR